MYWKFVVSLVFLHLVLCRDTSKVCPPEYSIIAGTQTRAKWRSEPTLQNQLVISEPPCLDVNNNLITRICSDGFWYPPFAPFCQKLKNEDICRSNYCAEVLDSTKISYWLPVQRKTNFGHFESTKVGEDYGTPQPLNVSDYREYYSGDCLFFDGPSQKIKIENCTEAHKSMRYFPKNFRTYKCDKGCLPNNYNFECYCKLKNCENLATIKSIKLKKIVEKVAGNELCQVGQLGPFLSTKSYINGTFLSFGNYDTDCTICVKHAPTYDTKLVLSFEERKKKLYLLVYYPEGLIHHDHEPAVFCFTNAAKSSLKDKSKINLVYEKREADDEHFPHSLSVYRLKLQNYMGEYWCEAFSSNFSTLMSNTVIAFEKQKGNEYALRIVYRDVCKLYSCDLDKFFIKIRDQLRNVLKAFSPEIRLMEVFDFDLYQDVLDVLIHVSTGKNYSVTMEHKRCLTSLNGLTHVDVKYFRSSEFCLPNKTELSGLDLNWPLTKLNNVAISDEFCLMRNGTPVVRQCRGNFLYGAVWADATGYCMRNATISEVTTTLRQISKSNGVSGETLWRNIKHAKLSVVDIYYLGIILWKFYKNDSSHALDIVNKLMTTDEKTLRISQKQLNLTDIALLSTEEILSNVTFDAERVSVTRKDNLIVHLVNPFLTNTSGFLLYGRDNSSFSELSIVDMTRNDSLDTIETESLLLGVYFPEMFLEHVLNETENNVSDITIVTVIFYNDSLFVDNTYQSSSFVVSVSISGYGSYLETPIPIIFRSKNISDSKTCGFWDHGKQRNWKKGEWSQLGSNYEEKFNDEDLHLCSYIHLTHFALLIMSDTKNLADEPNEVISNVEENEHILEILTIIGCSLSVFGIVGIFLTAILFEKWRSKIGTKILLHSSVAILLEIICIHLSEIKYLKTSEQICKVIGMILHYVVLSKFSWMLIYALLQYYRFVKVLGGIPKNLILKSVIIGWGGPLLLVFITGMSTDQSYVSVSYELCYPRGLLFYYTVLTPIIAIMVANITIFCVVMYNVTHTKKTSSGDKKLFKLRLYLALLLFSALGIPWIFGILAEIWYDSTIKVILYYIFCITATLQGFVLFVFYVVLNKETRDNWLKYVKENIL